MALYAAADAPLPELPSADPPPPLSVRPIRGDEALVRAQFSKPHVYYLGADTGCSCGFSYDAPEAPPQESRDSIRQLRAYLADVVRLGSVELYACWGGDEGEPARSRAQITPAYFVDDAEVFELPERWLVTVTGAAS